MRGDNELFTWGTDMNSMVTSLIAFACIFGGALVGFFLRSVLPDLHLRDDSKDVVKLGSGLIATLAALVLGLLVSSAKTSFDEMNAGITQSGAKIILLDRLLASYGPETKATREQLRRTVAAGIKMIWPEHTTGASGLTAFERVNGMEAIQKNLRELTPATDAQRQLLSQAQQVSNDLLQYRWLLIEQEQGSLPTVFLAVLVFWFAMLFATFGLFAPPNVTVIVVLLVCALSVSGALFLILEMNRPLEGMMKVSGAPLYKALDQLGR
jgi:Protein of unknown function (DUF4239)